MKENGTVTLGAGIKRATMSAVITRADGTIVDLGIIADSDNNPVAPHKKRLGLLERMRRFF